MESADHEVILGDNPLPELTALSAIEGLPVKPTLPTYTYHTIAMGAKPISLVCEDQITSEPYPIEFVSCSKTCERQVSEMSRVMRGDFHIALKGKNKAYVYFLKYRHLQDHDLEALERIRKQSLRGDACFVFVDATAEEMAEPITKLAKGVLPLNVVLLPWESQMSEATRRVVIGLAVSLITEDQTSSQRVVTKARVPVRPA